MRIKLLGSLIAFVLMLAGSASAQEKAGEKGGGPPRMRLMSSAFADGASIPNKYTRYGQSVSPELTWTNVPNGTVSFVLLFHDVDNALQRTSNDVTHWIIWNIPGTATKLDEGVKGDPTLLDGAIQGKNSRNTIGYLGPGAPANGPDHHYTFELFALDTKLDLGPDTPRAEVMKAMDGHIVGKAVWFGRFHQQQ